MLLNLCVHRVYMRAVIDYGRRVKLPVHAHWPQACKGRSLNTASRAQQVKLKSESRSRAQWRCAATTTQDAPAAGVAHTSSSFRIACNHLSSSSQNTVHITQSCCFAAPAAMRPPTSGYRLPPDEIVEIVDQPPEPSLAFSPDRKKVHDHLFPHHVCCRLNPAFASGHYNQLHLPQVTTISKLDEMSDMHALLACRLCSCIGLHPCLPYPSWLGQS